MASSRTLVARRLIGCGLALSGSTIAAAAAAQSAPDTSADPRPPQAAVPSSPPTAQPQADTLSPGTGDNQDIIVTATKRSESISRVPMSIAAISQQSLDQQGIRTASDLSRAVPNLTLRPAGSDGSTAIAIRGIISTQGAATTAVYLDDVPLQKRQAPSPFTGSATPIPQLFDLERIEVLRGPQGTLFGGSSLGGAIRFITPEPSLVDTSLYGRAETAFTEGGAPTYEAGIAIGGPLVQDRLGFRISAITRHNGGWIDRVDAVNPARIVERDTNSQNLSSVRAQLLFKPSDAFRIKASVYAAFQDTDDADFYYLDVPQNTVPTRSYTSGGVLTTAPAQIAYTVPAFTYGPLNYGPGKVANLSRNFSHGKVVVPTLTADLDLGGVALKSIGSYIYDHTSGVSDQPVGQMNPFQGVVEPYFYLAPGVTDSQISYVNNRTGFTQELRASTNGSTRAPFSAVGGLFFSTFHNTVLAVSNENLDAEARIFQGVSSLVKYGLQCGAGCISNSRDQTIDEREIAAFGEVNVRPFAPLQLTAGARVSHARLEYSQTVFGGANGFLVATATNGGLTSGSLSEKPITPKFSVSFDLDRNSILYATAAKGYRIGGVNANQPAVTCAAAIAALGGIPQTYESDSLWSYEAGAKLNLFGGRARINASGFYIKWSNIQTTVPITGCTNASFVANAASAISKGADIDAQIRLFPGLRAHGAVSYTHAIYDRTTSVTGLGAVTTVLVTDGDRLPISPWTVNAGLEYTQSLSAGSLYVNGDYQYASAFKRTPYFPSNNYGALVYPGNSTEYTKLRLGYRTNAIDLSFFVDNVFDSQDTLTYLNTLPGPTGCATAACTSFRNVSYLGYVLTYRPRTFGLTATLRR